MKTVDDPILQRLKQSFTETFGDRLERLVLFGSRARGDERSDSDYDIALFLKGTLNFGRDSKAIAKIETDILFDTGAVINSLPFAEGAEKETSGLMHELRREGLIL